VNRRALAIAVVVGILGIFLLFLYQRRFEVEASGGERVRVLTVVKQVDRGKALSEDNIATREIPIAYVEERSVKEAEKSKILNLRVGTTVKAGQTLMWTDLATANEDRKELSVLVQPGYRAVSIRTARDDSSIALIRPGDYVDVIGVLGAGGISEAKNAVVLLQRVLVLATGVDTSVEASESRDKSADRENLLTLSLTLPEAQILALAAERGRLAVAVRNPEDNKTTVGLVDINMDAILKPEQRATIPGVRTPRGPTVIGGGGQNP
jgi:pilus assembly protein CpaB